MASEKQEAKSVTTTIKESFFDDPFFKVSKNSSLNNKQSESNSCANTTQVFLVTT